MPVNQRASGIRQQFAEAVSGILDNLRSPRLHLGQRNLHITFEMNSKPRRFARHMCHLGTGHHGLRRSAAGVDTSATQDLPFDRRDRLSHPGES